MNAPIGVFDSGVGGLTVAREIMRQLPEESMIYFGDTARVPYGTKSKDTIVRYSRQIVNFLLSKGVKAVVIACNTASALALADLQDLYNVPIIGMVGRLSNQKGLDLVDYVIADIMKQDVQLVVLGMGDSRYVNLFSWAEGEYRGRVAARFAMDNDLAHQIYGGCDLFLMPSQFEPCGLSQLIALRYGTVPIVRETGGLRDTVLSYNEFTGEGNGFSFFNYNAHDMLHVIERALKYYHEDKTVWRKLQKRGMTADYSWAHSSQAYLNLYEQLIHPVPVPAASPSPVTPNPVVIQSEPKKRM